jgi:hypothetical protein
MNVSADAAQKQAQNAAVRSAMNAFCIGLLFLPVFHAVINAASGGWRISCVSMRRRS